MPELPEVEAVCRRLRAEAAGAEIVGARVVRARAAPRRIERLAPGRRVEWVRRRGKNILLDLSGGLTLGAHLRMTGNLYVVPDVRLRPAATRVWFELAGGRGLIFEDPRALGRMWIGEDRLEVGLEPLGPEFTPEAFAELAWKSRQPAKLFLMDQRRVAGLGNIYAAEALWRARIHPQRAMARVSRAKLAALRQAIVEVLEQAVESAVRAYAAPGLLGEAEDFPRAVYDREGESCARCGRKIRRIPQGGRSTYFCPGCQR